MKKESDDGLVSAKIRQIFHLQNGNNSFPNSKMIKKLTIPTFLDKTYLYLKNKIKLVSENFEHLFFVLLSIN